MSQMCQRHWTALKEAIKERGLYHFTADDGPAVVEQITRPDPAARFEPLMNAYMAMVQNILNVNPQAVVANDGCQLCFLMDDCRCGRSDCRARYEEWINKAADEQLEAARRLGLVPRPGTETEGT